MHKKATVLLVVFISIPSLLPAQEKTLYEQGYAEYREGRYLQAIELFEEHIRADSTDNKVDDAKWRIGRSLIRLDRPMEAEPYFREVSAQSGNRQDDASFDLAELLYDTGRSDDSLEHFLIFLKDFPESDRADDAYWYIGEIYVASDRVDEAEVAFRVVVDNLESNRRDEALYSLGYLLYTVKRNDEALETFNTLLAEYPDDSKVDDSMWRIGRIYMRWDQDEVAKTYFQNILDLPKSNRYDEASFDLGRIEYYTDKDYVAVIERFSPLVGREKIGLYQKKGVFLGGKAFYSLGRQARRDHKDEAALEYFNDSVRWFEYLLEKEDDDAERAEILAEIGKAHDHLYDLSKEKEVAMGHVAASEAAFINAAALLEGSAKEDVLKDLSDIQRADTTFITYDLSVLGGFETLVARPGARIYSEVKSNFPAGYRHLLSTALSFRHEDLTIKTFNFDPGQSGLDRLVSRNDTLALDLGWKAGNIRSFRNDLLVTTSYRWAEDPGDNRFLAAIEDTLRWRIAPNWKLDTDVSATLKIYPEYLSGSNKIDSFTPAVRPEVTFYGIDWMAIALAYEFAYKQYLQATYGGSNENKYYLINSGEIEFQGRFGVFRPSLLFGVSWLDSYNYDLTVPGLPAPQFVADYWDNITYALHLDLDFRFSHRFNMEIQGKLDYRAFTNYPARDETNTFTGELRKDLSVEISLDMNYIFWEKKYTAISGVLQARWVQDVSNMLYQNSIATNFQSFGAYLGVRIERL